MNYKNKLAFTFVEMIIAISIVVLLAVVGNGSLSTYKEKSNNSKVMSDLSTLNNSLLSYSTENSKLPKAGGNNNYFKSDTSYAHSWIGADTFGAHGFITQDTLPNKYLNYLPLDPVTSQYYAYGRTKTDLQFEVAGVILKDSQPISLVNGNYTAETGPYNLIREYNGPDFVYDKSTSVFPYNPYEKVLTAKISDFSGSVIDIKINNNSISTGELLSYTLRKGDKINLGTGTTADIYFSDGTLSTLGDLTRASELILSDMSFGGENNLITKIKLVLGVGTIWSQATSLGNNSQFNIYTTNSSAAVRGTVFGVNKVPTKTSVVVLQGNVDVKKVKSTNDTIAKLTKEISKDKTVDEITTKKDISKGKSINNINNTNTNLGTITSNTNIISKLTLDKVGKLTNAIQLKIQSYEKNNTGIKIILKLNKVIKKKAEYLKLKVKGKIPYKLYNNNWSSLKELTLTGGTTFSGTGFTDIIKNKSKIKLSFCKTKKNGKAKCTKPKEIKLITGKYTKADIGDCPRNSKKFNHECLPKPTGELKDWELIAYAPYDNTSTGTMYLKDGKTIPVFSSGVTYNSTGVTIYIGSNYLYYSGSKLKELGSNFAIEMRVKGLNRTSSALSYVLFSSDTGKIKLLNGEIKYYNLDSSVSPGSSVIKNNNYGSGFYNVIITKNKMIIKNDSGIIDSTGITMKTPNFLNIGYKKDTISPHSYINQWSEIIDYIKIYKR